ncbi:MAG: type I CRISPR-associated protein Cas7 [Candidatus Micrarchaeia archaeon]
MENKSKENENKEYNKFAAGVVVLRAQDANWNADFSGWPRKLPDGRFYSTDKALKYAIRKYLKEIKNETVIFWRVYNEKGEVGNLPAILKKNEINIEDNKEVPKEVLEKGIDVRLFGGTFTLKKQLFSITGCAQITYGIDLWNKGKPYVSQIQSPKYEGKEEYGPQSTLGSEVRLTEAHYSFDFTINPNNLKMDNYIKSVIDQQNIKNCLLSEKDVNLFREALLNAPNYTTSTTKNSVFTELLIFAEVDQPKENNKENNKENGISVPLVPILKNTIKIEESDGVKRKINISETIKTLKDLGFSQIKVYYHPELCDIECGNIKVDKVELKVQQTK